MLSVRVACAPGRTADVLRLLRDDDGVAHVAVFEGASREPAGDVVLFDVAREAADALLDGLRDLGVERDGAVTVTEAEIVLSDAARRAERAAPGAGPDAVLWDEVERRTEADAELTWSYVVFLAVAVQLAGIAVVLDNPILIVGAMVLGPEFGPLARISVGLLRRKPGWVGRGLRTLAVGFAVAIAVTLCCAAVSRGLGWIEPGMLTHRPLTAFVVHPDKWSFIVALLAGCAGVLSITSAKSSTLVGVFISVTTVPAAGNIAVAAALAAWRQVGLSAVQLSVNLAGIVVAGAVTLLVQRTAWTWVRDNRRLKR